MNRDSDVPLRTALKRRCSDTRGFALTEAIAAAAVLALLALGVLAGLDGAASSTGREKARSAASALAEQDQERLHAMRAVDLPEFRDTRVENVGGTNYTIVSEADWISDVNGGTPSCTSPAGKADYLRLRSTVTSSTVGTQTMPVRIDSLVAPPIGSAGGNNGTLAVQVNDRDALGEDGIPVSIAGTTATHTDTKTTNDLGCAVFALIPGQTYNITLNKPGWVDPGGNQLVETTGNVTPGATTVTSLVYDQRAQVTTGFDTKFFNYATGASDTRASKAWNQSLSNPGLPLGPRVFADTASTPAPLATMVADNLFPFANGYGIYAGKCTQESPETPLNSVWASTNAHQITEPNTDYVRTAPVRMPALPVRIHNGTVTIAGVVQKSWLGGAQVAANLVVPAPPAGEPPLCTDFIEPARDEPTWGLQSYPSSGSLAGSSTNNYANGLTGLVTKKPGVTGGQVDFDPGMPFGTWIVCADITLKVSGTNRVRRNFVKVDNTTPDGVPTPSTIDLNWSAGGNLQRDRNCSDTTGWPAL